MNSTPRPFPPWARTNLKISAVSALGLGFALIFLPPQTILYNPLTNFISNTILRRPLPSLSLQSNLDNLDNLGQSLAFSGVFSYVIGVVYAISYFHGYEEWLYIGIPAKLSIAAMGLLIWAVKPEKFSPLLFAICAVDGLGATALAWAIGSFSGRVPEGYGSGKKEL